MASYASAGFLAPSRLLYTTIYDVQPSPAGDTLLAVDSRGCLSIFDLSCTRNLEFWKQLRDANTQLVRPATTLNISSSALYAVTLASGVYVIAGEDGVCCYTPPPSSSPSAFLPPWSVPPQRALSRGVGPVSAALCVDAVANHTSAAAAVGQGDGQVSLYDIARGCFISSIDCSAQVNGIAAFKSSAPGGVAACADGALRVFDVRAAKVQRCLFHSEQHTSQAPALLSCCILADDQVAAVGSSSGWRSWHIPSSSSLAHAAAAGTAAVTPCAEGIAAAGNDGSVAVYRMTGMQSASVQLDITNVYGLAYVDAWEGGGSDAETLFACGSGPRIAALTHGTHLAYSMMLAADAGAAAGDSADMQ